MGVHIRGPGRNPLLHLGSSWLDVSSWRSGCWALEAHDSRLLGFTAFRVLRLRKPLQELVVSLEASVCIEAIVTVLYIDMYMHCSALLVASREPLSEA